MVTRVEHDPLRVEFDFPDGTQWTARLEGTANPALAAELAAGLVQLTHPLGDVSRKGTAIQYASTIRKMAAALADAGFQGGVADLRRGHMLEYWLAATPARIMYSRMLLKGCGERVDAELRAHLVGRAIRKAPASKPWQPYSEAEWKAIETALRERVAASISAHRQALTLAGHGPDGANRGVNRQNLAWVMREHGPLSRVALASVMEVSLDALVPASAVINELRDALFPPVDAVIAARYLFGVYSGVVPDGIRDLGLEDMTWAGDRTVLLNYIKHRRGPESVNLSSRGVRLLERWLECSELLRTFAPAETAAHLWIYRDVKNRPGGPDGQMAVLSSVEAPTAGVRARKRLFDALGLLTDDGKPLTLHASRIRTTYHNQLSRRGWTGRTTIDPNHTARVEGGHYVSATTPAQKDALESIIEDAQADLLRRTRPPVLLTDEEAADFVAAQPQEAERLGLDEAALAELLGGEMDVFTASCANQLAGLHGPKGKPCPARPWVCLMCPLAVFLPRHAPNLLRLKAYFARQSRRMTTQQFLAVFGPYADRLDHDILTRFDERTLAQAAGVVEDTDAELPLRPEEGTTAQ
ncbi:hypothetical protein [Kitasatospora sp. NPDC004531]